MTASEPTPNASRRLARQIAVVATVVASAIFFVRIRSYALVGWDTLPEIASSRIDSLASLVGTFTERTAEGYFPYGAFYRPLFNLSLALDHAVWGLDPLGYLLTGLLLYAATALATYVLAERLLGAAAPIAPLVALVTFLLLPMQIEIVPIVSRRADMLCTLAVVLALATQLARVDRAMPRGAVLPAVWTACAVAAKEPGLVMVPLAFIAVLLTTSGVGAVRVRRALGAGAMHALAAGLVSLGRLAVIGGMGGLFLARPSGAIDRLPEMLGRSLLQLTSLDALVPESPASFYALTALVVAATVAVTLWALVAAPSASRVLATSAIAGIWIVSSSAIFGVAGLLQQWYLFVQAPAVALLAAAAVQAALAGMKRRGGFARPASAAGLAVFACWLALQARSSPLVHRYGHWLRASELTTQYLAALQGRIEHASPGAVIALAAPPVEIVADGDQHLVRRAMVLRTYSVQAWSDLVFGDDRVVVRPAGAPAEAADAQRVVVVLEPATAGTARGGS